MFDEGLRKRPVKEMVVLSWGRDEEGEPVQSLEQLTRKGAPVMERRQGFPRF